MKPTVIRNKTIYQATNIEKSKLLCSHLSKDLQGRYNKRSIRVSEGDTVKVLRGEYQGVSGKITHVSTEKNGAAIEGIKKEKLKGGNVDVFIHTSNLLVTDVNTEDKWRQSRLEGKPKSQGEVKPVEEVKPQKEEKEVQEKPKEAEKPKEKKELKAETKQKPKENKESKTTKKAKKEETK